MKKTESKYFMDSSAWLSYFYGQHKKAQQIVEENNIKLTSVLSIFEIKRKLLRDKEAEKTITDIISFIKQRSLITDLTEPTCEEAAATSLQEKLPAVDALIYQSSRAYNCTLVTGDTHFAQCKNVLLLS